MLEAYYPTAKTKTDRTRIAGGGWGGGQGCLGTHALSTSRVIIVTITTRIDLCTFIIHSLNYNHYHVNNDYPYQHAITEFVRIHVNDNPGFDERPNPACRISYIVTGPYNDSAEGTNGCFERTQGQDSKPADPKI